MPDFLDHLKAEILALERSLEADPRWVKLRELRNIEGLYEDGAVSIADGDSPGFIDRPVRRPATRVSSPETQRVIDESTKLLAGQQSPMPIREMFHEIVEVRGCRIGGRDPVNGLSAILSRSGGFRSHGRSGWTLATTEDEPKTEAPNSSELSGAPRANGAEPLNL
jgi:hypothetical protein